MYSIKPGRGPSMFGGVVFIIMGFFGIGFAIFSYTITHLPDLPAPAPIGIIFPLFGLAFTGICVAGAIYHFRNAGAKNRFSALDITTSQEEPCPLNERFGAQAPSSSSSVEAKLSQLLSLKEKGLISEAEYAAQRQRILDEI